MFDIEPDVCKARLPPAGLYTDPAVFKAQHALIFDVTWQAIAAAAPTEPKTSIPVELAGRPCALTCDASGTLRCLSNVCTHRGHPVVTEAIEGRSLRCPYHGRRFELDGRFISMPKMVGACDFPTADDDLRMFALHRLGPVIFSGIDPKIDFDALVAPVLRHVDVSLLPMAASDTTRYVIDANWALYCDNYLEGLHIPFVHPELAAELQKHRYEIELFDHGNVQRAFAPNGEIVAQYFWLFPYTMLNFYPWGLSLNVVRPLAVDKTEVTFVSFVSNPELRELGPGAELDRVERQDELAVQRVQKGLESGLCRRGRYSPTEEKGLHQFHQLMARYLTPTT